MSLAVCIAAEQHLLSRRQLAARWNMPMELAIDLSALALYDIVIYADDSGSMAFEEGGDRINDLKLIVGRVAEVTLLSAAHSSPCAAARRLSKGFHAFHAAPKLSCQ